MNCPEHLVFKALNDHVYLWLYWRDVPRHTIPLRVWLNPLRYELFIRGFGRVRKINPEGRWARLATSKWLRLRDAITGAKA